MTTMKTLGLAIAFVLLMGGTTPARTPRVTGQDSVGATIQTITAPDRFGPWTLVGQGSNQDVVNSTTLVASNLCVTIQPDRLYEIQANLIFGSGPAASGLRYNITMPATTGGIWEAMGSPNTNCTIPCAASTSAGISLTQPIQIRIWKGWFRAPLTPNPGGPVCVEFANNIAAVGNTTRLFSNSTLAWRQLDP